MPPQTRKTTRSVWREWLARLLPPLAFHEPLETRYRAWYVHHARARMRYTMLPAMGLLLLCALAGGPFADMRAALFNPTQQPLVDALRFGLLAPTAIAMCVVIYTNLYERWLNITSQYVCLAQGLCFVAFDVLMREQGYSLSSWMPLVALGSYMVFGMLQVEAARCSIALVAAYWLVGWLQGIDGGQRHFDLAVMGFASAMGCIAHYGFARALRHTWFAQQVLSDSANRDALTGIANRRMFDEHIERLWQQAIRTRAPLSLVIIDLDQFKAYNDRYGHQAGDHCLTRVARVIAQAARRPLDLAARYGGEEFVVLLYDVQRDRVEELCRELHENLAALAIPHAGSTVEPHVTFSIGVACVEPTPGRRHAGMTQLADEALYAAKETGRNRTIVMDREYETLQTGAFRVRRRPAA